MKKTLILSILGIALFLHGLGQKGEASFFALSVDDGLSGSLVKSLYQDKRGFLWVGVENGLNRYDGYHFISHTYQNIPDTTTLLPGIILAICEGDSGHLWIGTDNGLCRYNPKYQTFTHHPLPIPSTVRSLLFDRDHTLWIGTEEGLFSMEKGKDLRPFPLLPDDLPPNILHLYQDSHGNIWAGSEDQGLLRLDSTLSVTHFTTYNSDLLSNKVNHLFEDLQGQLWIGTGKGVFHFEAKQTLFAPFDLPQPATAMLQKSEVESIAEDQNGNIWFGTFDNGLFKYNWRDGQLDRFTSKANQTGSLSDSVILSLLVDRSGLLWVGTLRGGLNAHNPLQIHFGDITKDPQNSRSLLSNEVYAIMEDKQGDVWFGTDAGLSIMRQSNGLHTHLLSTGRQSDLSGDAVYSLLQDHQGNIWVGTGGDGLNRISAANAAKKAYKFSHYTYDNGHSGGLISDDISCLYQDKKEVLWVGTLEGLSAMEVSGKWKNNYHAKNSQLSNIEIQSIFEDSQNTLWVGTIQGLNRYDASSDDFSPLLLKGKEAAPLVQGTIFAMHEDHKQQLWVGTDRGLCRLNPARDRCQLYTVDDGLPDNIIYSISQDSRGNLWLSTRAGLSKLKHQQGPVDFTVINYSNRKGQLHCDAFNYGAYHLMRSGHLIFGCNQGAVMFHPDNIKENEYPPPVVITDFELFFHSVSFGKDNDLLQQHISETKKIVLAPDQNTLKFEFVGLSFLEPTKNEYRYIMENLDGDWTYSRDVREAIYRYVDPGTYVFRVQAANNEGIWNKEGAAIEIVIETPFTQTIGFYLICIAGALLLVIAYVQVRTRNLEQNKRRLEAEVVKRTEEVQAKNETLEQTLRDLQAAQTQLVEAEKMASLGQLTAGVAHEINNPITFVSGNITPLKRDIDEIFQVLNSYEERIKEKGLEAQFETVKALKEELDYDFLIPEINQLLKGIQEGAERTSEIVKGLRNFSRLDEDVLKLANVNEGIESTLLILRNEFKNRIEIVKDLEEMPDIMCYPGKLNGVYMNILTNAAQAIDGEGKITIKTRYDNKNVYISFTDTGEGMPEEVRKRIFEPFFTTKEVGFGTGLGLSITYGTIENHKGKITVESELGKGTTFHIVLPA